MAQAFRCDKCAEFHTGEPALVLLEDRTGYQNKSTRVISELCSECKPKFMDEFTLESS